MTAKASLKQIADDIGMQCDENVAYFDRVTGEVVVVFSDVTMDMGQPLAELPEWQRELVEIARSVAADESGRYLSLPGKWDFDEYEVMRRFCQSLDNEKHADQLFHALRGRGAFRRFKGKCPGTEPGL
ncbi:MAG: hypothetical protein HQL87_05035 [Magnetococcales bacterium]|nr:hypothetical protein [Magnetococcales bacterium]